MLGIAVKSKSLILHVIHCQLVTSSARYIWYTCVPYCTEQLVSNTRVCVYIQYTVCICLNQPEGTIKPLLNSKEKECTSELQWWVQ